MVMWPPLITFAVNWLAVYKDGGRTLHVGTGPVVTVPRTSIAFSANRLAHIILRFLRPPHLRRHPICQQGKGQPSC